MPKRNDKNNINEVPNKKTKQNPGNESNESEKADKITPSMVDIAGCSSNSPTSTTKIDDPIKNSVVDNSEVLDRYKFNFWKKSENKLEANQALKINEIQNTIKINELSIGKFENQPLIVRISYKSHVKDTSKGKCVSFLLIDESGEISLASFGKLSMQLFKEMEMNCIYRMSNFLVYEENINYPSGSGNKLQIKANNNFNFQHIVDDNVAPKIKFNFESIESIKSKRINTRVDLLGILIKDFGVEENTNSNNMRDLHITDRSQGDIIATLWGGAAENFKGIVNSPIVIRKAVVSIYKEIKKINCTAGTSVWVNPNIPEATLLNEWFIEMNVLDKERNG